MIAQLGGSHLWPEAKCELFWTSCWTMGVDTQGPPGGSASRSRMGRLGYDMARGCYNYASP